MALNFQVMQLMIKKAYIRRHGLSLTPKHTQIHEIFEEFCREGKYLAVVVTHLALGVFGLRNTLNVCGSINIYLGAWHVVYSQHMLDAWCSKLK